MKFEDKSVQNCIKKKKHNQRQVFVPENKHLFVDYKKTDVDVKKEKKSKQSDNAIMEQESFNVADEKEKKGKKKKNVSDSLCDPDAMDSANDGVMKKKKKKPVADDMIQVKMEENSVNDVEKKQRRNKKKLKNKTVQVQNISMKNGEEEDQQTGKNTAMDVKKRKGAVFTISVEETDGQTKKKKKKKHKTSEVETAVGTDKTATKPKCKVGENGLKLEQAAGEVDVSQINVKKKVKKEAKPNEDETVVETPEITGNKKKRKAKKKAKVQMMDETEVITEEEETQLMQKGKKDNNKASVAVSEMEDTEPKKKKRKKESSKEKEKALVIKCDEAEESGLIGETPLAMASDSTCKKSKKKKVKQVENKVSVETAAKKKKKMKDKVEDQHEPSCVNLLSEKSGNTDMITTNQERRHALEIETDKTSQPEKAANLSGLGQWSTAEFDSSEQQQKFLRLMGGFKKGFQSSATGTKGGNMAMDKNAQQQLQQGLLGQFERAHSRRMEFSNKGAGLGFTTPSNKKFSIDISACRSVRFDD